VVSDLGFTFAGALNTQAKQGATPSRPVKGQGAQVLERAELERLRALPTAREPCAPALELNDEHESGKLGW
jgi:hypothetical protein